jgi:hypothetical protein
MATTPVYGEPTSLRAPLQDNYLEVRQMFEVLSFFQAPYLEEKLLAKGKFLSKDEYEEAFRELKKYFVLCHVSSDGVGMISETVDEVWHQFILFTREYHAFCTKYFGHYFHHRPNLASTPIEAESRQRFLTLYGEHFGLLPKIWGVCGKAAGEVAADGASCAQCMSCMGCMGSGCMGCAGGGGGGGN